MAFVLAALLALTLVSCQSPEHVAEDYRETLADEELALKNTERTAVVFVIDGLSASVLKQALDTKSVPAIAGFFPIAKANKFDRARASFPSLTFPNLTSLLTGKPVSEHPIAGNRILVDDEEVNFENVVNWPVLDKLVENRTVFHKLTARGETSVSYSYQFPRGATAYQKKNLDAGLDYMDKNYEAIDTATIESLQMLLAKDPWPRFVFVHLIGVDAAIHRFGPRNEKVIQYLSQLDRQLSPVFEILRARKPKRATQVALTADHGFQEVKTAVSLDEVVARIEKKLKTKIRLVSDNRVASLHFRSSLSQKSREMLTDGLRQVPHVQWTILRDDDSLKLFHADGRKAKIEFAPASCPGQNFAARFLWLDRKTGKPSPPEKPFSCLDSFDRVSSEKNDAFLVPALAEYFRNASAPDIVVIPDDQSDFSGEYAGNHGGLTTEEMLVPLLTRYVHLPEGTIPTSKLLRTMGLPVD